MSNQLYANLMAINEEKQVKIIPENIKSGVTIFGVDGSLEIGAGDVKLFETIEEMQADTTAKEGDLAVVYRSEVQNATVDSQFQTATFPNTVVLDTAITDYVDVRYRAVDNSVMFECMGQFDSSRFMMDCYTDSGSIRIQYESSDGITYTRTDGGDETVDFGTEIYYEYTDMWNDVIGYFIQVGGNYFEGLYQNQLDKTNIQFMNINAIKVNISDDKSSVTLSIDEMDKNATHFDKVELIAFCERHNISLGGATFYLDSSNNLCYSPSLGTLYDFNGNFLGYTLNGNWSNASTNFYKLDFNNDLVVSLPSLSATSVWYAYNTTTKKYYLDKDSLDCTTIPTYISEDSSNKYSSSVMVASTSTSDFTSSKYVSYDYNYQGLGTVYLIADSQFNLMNSNELLPGKVAYGKNGVITGDDSIYSNLDKEAMFLQTLGMTKQLDEERYRVYDTTTIPYTIGSYEINTAKYISETADMENADYVLGKLVDYKTLQSITNISGIIYSQAYFAKSSVDDTYFIFVKQATDNTYHILQINTTFTEVIDDILINCTEAYCDVCNDNIMMLRVTDSTSETPYKYVVFNYTEKELVTLIPASANSYTSGTIFISDRNLIIVNNKTTYLYDIKHNTVMTVGETESNLRRTDVFMFDTFTYVAKTMHSGSTATRKLYKYTDETQALILYATYTGGSYLSMSYASTILVGMNCIETDTYILDYGRNVVYAKQNITGNSNSIARTKCNVNGKTINSGLYYQGNNCISDNINYTFVVPNASAITVTDSAIATFTYSVEASSFGKRFRRGVAISEDYDTDAMKYKLQSFEFNYSGATVLYGLTHFNYSGFNAYAEYEVKYYNETLNDPDYMLLKTSFKASENMSIAPYLKLFNLKTCDVVS